MKKGSAVKVPATVSVAEAVLWLRRAALAMPRTDAEMFRGLAAFLQTTIATLESKEQRAERG